MIYRDKYAIDTSIRQTLELQGCPENLEGIFTRSLVSLLGGLPVDDFPNVLDIGGLSVEVLHG